MILSGILQNFDYSKFFLIKMSSLNKQNQIFYSFCRSKCKKFVRRILNNPNLNTKKKKKKCQSLISIFS